MFYDFRQNNSGGSFTYDEKAGISVNVIVEADSPEDANKRAESIGLYFDGAGDCSCCGNRWYEQRGSEEGDEQPSTYGESIEKPFDDFTKWIKDGYEGFVHYKDGRIVGFWHSSETKA